MRNRIAKITPFYRELDTFLRISPAKIVLYLSLIFAIELHTIWIAPGSGTFYYGVLFIILLHHYLLDAEDPNRDQLLLLSAIPLMRILSMAMPVGLISPLYRYPMVGIPVFTAIILMVKQTQISWKDLGVRLPEIKRSENFWESLLIALSGIPLGIIGYYFGNPISLVSTGTPAEVITAAIIVLIFIGVLEEIVFRGLLLHTLIRSFGRMGIVLSSAIYLLLFASSGSIGLVVLMGFVSLLYSWHALESRSILAVTVSHSLMLGGMLIFYPLIF